MTIAATKDLMSQAWRSGPAIAAFNVITLEQAEAVVAAAEARMAPVIVQVSENAIRFHADRPAPLMRGILALIEESSATAAMHLDHATSAELCRAAVDAGASSVMFDAAHLEFDENVRATARLAEWAHAHGIYVEAELGAIGGKEGAHAPGVRTDPVEAKAFVAATAVDALAVAVGSTHAQHTRTTSLNQDLIARLRDAVPVPLVLHGSSGVSDDEIIAAIRHGIVKVNIGTALNISYTEAVRQRLMGHEAESDPRPGLRQARAALTETVAQLLDTVRQPETSARL
ncbi:MAG TPA: class II fructose-bisphosphate aldolase [Pseudolysinimonas sp.]|jgi:fructose-bisphosphate aldolase class II